MGMMESGIEEAELGVTGKGMVGNEWDPGQRNLGFLGAHSWGLQSMVRYRESQPWFPDFFSIP